MSSMRKTRLLYQYSLQILTSNLVSSVTQLQQQTQPPRQAQPHQAPQATNPLPAACPPAPKSGLGSVSASSAWPRSSAPRYGSSSSASADPTLPPRTPAMKRAGRTRTRTCNPATLCSQRSRRLARQSWSALTRNITTSTKSPRRANPTSWPRTKRETLISLLAIIIFHRLVLIL